MTLPALDRAVLARRLAQVAQLRETYVPKTGQTGQSGQRIENARKFDATPDQKPTSHHPKLTSGTAQRSNPDVQVAGARLESAYAHPSDGTPHS
jgi:hypothetical protein